MTRILSEGGFHGRTKADSRGSEGDAGVRPVTHEGARLGWREAVAATVAGLGYELVDVERAPRGLLRVTIDRQPGHVYRAAGGVEDAGEFITVDDCEQVTRQLQYALEVEGLDYARLEVSSPGLDRPLRRETDYLRFAGQAVALTLRQPFQGRKNWQGLLQRADDGAWNLCFKVGQVEQVLAFALDEVREARLVPVVDFKGRKARPQEQGDGAATAAPARPGNDGG